MKGFSHDRGVRASECPDSVMSTFFAGEALFTSFFVVVVLYALYKFAYILEYSCNNISHREHTHTTHSSIVWFDGAVRVCALRADPVKLILDEKHARPAQTCIICATMDRQQRDSSTPVRGSLPFQKSAAEKERKTERHDAAI